ncbi:FtsX-like permease family protein [Actinophytocola sp.]|uniref:FtsX-like permease family protein n=1 Tax=Actinophytocola sp. TaxID=1872138 RepID=UPI002ED77A02
MTMLGLAVRSLRYRTTGFAASFLAMFLGAVILMSFASLLDTAAGDGVDATSAETLTLMASVVGGWGLLIVAFAVVSTLSLLAGQRDTEMALLKSIGATPVQVGRLIVGEAAVVALVAAAVAIPPAMFGGRLLIGLLRDTGQVAPGVTHRFGPMAIGIGIGITFVAATIAAAVTARRATRVSAREAMYAAAVDSPRLSGKRIAVGSVLVTIGVSCGVLTATVLKDMGLEGMAVAGQAVILSAIGLAVLAPALGRAGIAVLAPALRRLTGVSGYLTVLNIRLRGRQVAGALVPIILFTGIATGTLYLQSIENSAVAASGAGKSADYQNVETLNFVVVGMIAVFAAIMLINTLVAATFHRRREFGQQRLVGSTPPQVLGMVGVEGAVLTAVGVLFGTLASAAAIVPYSIARTGSALPDATIGIYLGIVSTAVVLTFAASLGAAGRAIRTPAVQAVAA